MSVLHPHRKGVVQCVPAGRCGKGATEGAPSDDLVRQFALSDCTRTCH